MAANSIDTNADMKQRTGKKHTGDDTTNDTTGAAPSTGSKSRRTSIIVSPEMFSQIKALADLRGVSVNSVIIEGIQRIIDENQDLITDFADYQAENLKRVIAYKKKE